jgi:hypothetical protein
MTDWIEVASELTRGIMFAELRGFDWDKHAEIQARLQADGWEPRGLQLPPAVAGYSISQAVRHWQIADLDLEAGYDPEALATDLAAMGVGELSIEHCVAVRVCTF